MNGNSYLVCWFSFFQGGYAVEHCGSDLPVFGCGLTTMLCFCSAFTFFLTSYKFRASIERVKGVKVYDRKKKRGFRFNDAAFKVRCFKHNFNIQKKCCLSKSKMSRYQNHKFGTPSCFELFNLYFIFLFLLFECFLDACADGVESIVGKYQIMFRTTGRYSSYLCIDIGYC